MVPSRTTFLITSMNPMKFVSWVRSKRVYCEIKLLKSLLFFPLLRLFGDLDLPFFPKSFFFALNFIECKQLRRYFSSIEESWRKFEKWSSSLAHWHIVLTCLNQPISRSSERLPLPSMFFNYLLSVLIKPQTAHLGQLGFYLSKLALFELTIYLDNRWTQFTVLQPLHLFEQT